MTRRTAHRSVLAAALLAAIPGTASAASFYIIESSVSRLGNAFSGTASAADDASTVYFNGAGMTRLDGPTTQLGGHYIMPEADFTNNGSTSATGTPLEAPLSGSDGTTDDSALVPNFYYATPLNDTVSFGLGINAPFGLTSEYDDDWVGRYHATNSELQTININPGIAFQATDRLSLGFGVNYQSIDATLENEVDASAACFSGRQAQGFPVTGNPNTAAGACATTHGGFGNRAADSSVEITGDDRSFGFDLSLLYEFTPDTRVGLSWRQGVDYTLEGRVSFDESASCAADPFCNGATTDGRIRANVELPDIITLSGTHGIGENWRVDADIAWYEWDSIQQLRIERPNGQEVSTLDLEYENTFRYSLGGTYTGFDSTSLRAGVAYDESPISGPETTTPRVPDGDRTWITVGATFELSDSSSIDVGYAHLFVDEVKVENTEQGNTLRGEFDPTVDILSVAANWRF
jgi:long-chain fatty acid transport protein